jgi:hypothetical protein
MIKVTVTLYRDKSLKDVYLMNPQHEIEISDDLKKARVINPWSGAWGMAKRSGLNNLNTVVQVTGKENYSVYSLRGMGQKVYFKIMKKDLVVSN